MNTIDLEVQGISCGACVKHVKQALEALTGVTGIDVDLQRGHVKVNGDLKEGGDVLVGALTLAGYPAKVSTSLAPIASAKKSSGGCCCG